MNPAGKKLYIYSFKWRFWYLIIEKKKNNTNKDQFIINIIFCKLNWQYHENYNEWSMNQKFRQCGGRKKLTKSSHSLVEVGIWFLTSFTYVSGVFFLKKTNKILTPACKSWDSSPDKFRLYFRCTFS